MIRNEHDALPPPLRGRVGEGGSPKLRSLWLTPTPDPSPQGGGEFKRRAAQSRPA